MNEGETENMIGAADVVEAADQEVDPMNEGAIAGTIETGN
jgi:hypothetical protein